jgi:hypothetical protein
LPSEHDPFTVPTPTVARSALSPTAESFTPGEPKDAKVTREPVLTASGRISTARIAKVPGELKIDIPNGRVSYLHANSVPDLVTPQVTYVDQARTSHGAVGEPSPPQDLVEALRQMSLSSAAMSLGPAMMSSYDEHYRFSTIMEGRFTADEVAQRAFKITVGYGNGNGSVHLQMLFNVSQST